MRCLRLDTVVAIAVVSLSCQLISSSSSYAWGIGSLGGGDQTAPAGEEQVVGYITDQAVQQAGYYDSRPMQRPAMQRGGGINDSTKNRSGALYHGQKVKMPTMLFGRSTSTNGTSQNVPQANQQMGSPMTAAQMRKQYNTQGLGSSYAAGPATSGGPSGGHVAAMPGSLAKVARTPQGQPAMPRPQAQARSTSPFPTAHDSRWQPTQPTQLRSLPNSTNVSPWETRSATPLTSKMPSASAATTLPASAAGPTAPVGPQTAADRLAAKAHELSTIAQENAQYSQIIELCQQALANQPTAPTAKYAIQLTGWAFNRRGQLKANAGNSQEAIHDFESAIAADDSCWRAYHNRGVLLAQAGQYAPAFDDFSRTIQLNPRFAKAYSNRAALFLVANDLETALSDYSLALQCDANLAIAHRGCGRACQLMGHAEEALGHFDIAVRLAPEDAYASACRADVLTDLGRYIDAAAEYDRSLKLDPNSPETLSSSAWLLATCPDGEVRNPELAIARANTVLEQSGGQDAVPYDTLAAAQASAGNFGAAIESVEKAIALAPEAERDAYKDRLLLYQQSQPYRIAPIETNTQQASYEATTHDETSPLK